MLGSDPTTQDFRLLIWCNFAPCSSHKYAKSWFPCASKCPSDILDLFSGVASHLLVELHGSGAGVMMSFCIQSRFLFAVELRLRTLFCSTSATTFCISRSMVSRLTRWEKAMDSMIAWTSHLSKLSSISRPSVDIMSISSPSVICMPVSCMNGKFFSICESSTRVKSGEDGLCSAGSLFLQLMQVQFFPQYLPNLKHSQYFFKHLR